MRLHGKTTDRTGEERVVYLPPQARRVLDKLPANRARLAGRVTVPRKLWNMIRKEVGCPDLWLETSGAVLAPWHYRPALQRSINSASSSVIVPGKRP
jgi:hypothetical protein